MILPGKTIGILGGGPPGRMLAQAAQTLGYRVNVFEPQPHCPAGAVANREINASYDDVAAMKVFAHDVDVITCAFENVPAESLAAIAAIAPVHPRAEVIGLCQNRLRQKNWLRANGLPHVRFAEALDGDIAAAVAQTGRPGVVKSADFGYNGMGQMRITDDEDLARAAAIFRGRRCVVERGLDFKMELCVLVARGGGPAPAETKVFPIAETIHARQMLDVSIVPARIGPALAREAEHHAVSIAEKLGVVGLLAVELFVSTNGELLVNEFVAHPHNSAHGSIEGCETSQFEQQVRAVCGWPLGPVGLREPTVMVNILGDAWTWRDGQPSGEPDWAAILGEPDAKLNVYGEIEPRVGKKMGHFTVRGKDIEAVIERARDLKERLNAGNAQES